MSSTAIFVKVFAVWLQFLIFSQHSAFSASDSRTLSTAGLLAAPAVFECTVKNTGSREGDAVVLGFVSASDPEFPAKRLFDF